MKRYHVYERASFFDVVSRILTCCFLIICIAAVALTLMSGKGSDGAISIFGIQMRIVISDSMEESEYTDVSVYEIKDIPVKSMIFIENAPEDEEELSEWYADIEVGDVLTFRYVYATQETITHRVIDKYENENGGYTFTLEGDNKASDSKTLTQTIDTSEVDSPNYIIGKVIGQSHFLGLLVAATKKPFGLMTLIIIPCCLLALLEFIRACERSAYKRRYYW